MLFVLVVLHLWFFMSGLLYYLFRYHSCFFIYHLYYSFVLLSSFFVLLSSCCFLLSSVFIGLPSFYCILLFVVFRLFSSVLRLLCLFRVCVCSSLCFSCFFLVSLLCPFALFCFYLVCRLSSVSFHLLFQSCKGNRYHSWRSGKQPPCRREEQVGLWGGFEIWLENSKNNMCWNATFCTKICWWVIITHQITVVVFPR